MGWVVATAIVAAIASCYRASSAAATIPVDLGFTLGYTVDMLPIFLSIGSIATGLIFVCTGTFGFTEDDFTKARKPAPRQAPAVCVLLGAFPLAAGVMLFLTAWLG